MPLRKLDLPPQWGFAKCGVLKPHMWGQNEVVFSCFLKFDVGFWKKPHMWDLNEVVFSDIFKFYVGFWRGGVAIFDVGVATTAWAPHVWRQV